jgi:AAA15 family ATPase/GTPase
MITQLRIRNYKSILDTTMELSNVNVFIGENGCGKTNILEALGMLSAIAQSNTSITMLTSKGIRVRRPSLTLSSFLGNKQTSNFKIDWISDEIPIIKISDILTNLSNSINSINSITVQPTNFTDIYSDWHSVNEIGFGYNSSAPSEMRDKHSISVNTNGLYNDTIETIKKDIPSFEINPEFENILKNLIFEKVFPSVSLLKPYLIFNLSTQSLRGISTESKEVPLGIHGEGLDVLLNDFSTEEWEILKRYTYLIDWLDDIVIDKTDKLKFEGHKLGRSNSVLYFRDKFMSKKNNVFAAENSNEGILHILFFLALVISKKTPRFFAIDNIESSLNPKLCRILMKILAELAIERDKQILITTHNPAILDGLNLHEDRQRLFVVKRTDEGYTQAERIKMKPDTNGQQLKLSELWMRGYIGGLPNNF